MKPLLTAKEAARLLGTTVGALYVAVARKEVPHVHLSKRRLRFEEDALEEWVKANRIPQQSPAGLDLRRKRR